MNPGAKLNALTAMGGRTAHRGLSAVFRQPYFDHKTARMPVDVLEKAVHNARYYGWANVFRAAMYVPVLVGLRGTGQWFSSGIIGALVAFHLICVLAENYKSASAKHLLASRAIGGAPPPPSSSATSSAPSSGALPFETERVYRMLGFEFVRKVVNLFIEYTQLTRAERRQGKRPEQMAPTRAGLSRYVADTRQAERMHFLAAVLNVPPLVSFWMLAKWKYAAWVGAILFIDTALVLLQRYLRVRITAGLRRLDAKRAARTAT